MEYYFVISSHLIIFLANLFIDTNYYIYINLNYFFTAVPSPPTPPLEIRTIGPNAIVIEWGIPESDGGAPLLGYNIAIRDTKKTMWMEIGRVQKGVQKFTIRDLQEDHEYMIRIFAKNEIGLSEPLESDEPFKVLPSGGELLKDLISENIYFLLRRNTVFLLIAVFHCYLLCLRCNAIYMYV